MKISTRMLPFAVLICALLWGSAFPGIKGIYADWEAHGLRATLPNRLLLAGVRFTLAGLILLLVSNHPLRQLKHVSLKKLLWFSATQVYFQYTIFYTALAVSGAILGGLMVSTGSLWWLLLAPLILKTPWPNKQQWALIIAGLIGVIIAVYRPGSGSGNPVLGAALFSLSTLSGAIAVITLQGLLKTMGARAATGWGLLFGGIMLSLSSISAWHNFTLLFTPTVTLLTLYLTLVSAVGFSIWNYLTSIFPVNLLAGYRFLIPVCAVIESSIFVKSESPGIGIFIGGTIVIASVIGLQKYHQTPASSPAKQTK